MDPLSATASVAGILDVVTRLGKLLYRMQRDLKNADADIEAARRQAQLLQEEIRIARELRESSEKSQRKDASDSFHTSDAQGWDGEFERDQRQPETDESEDLQMTPETFTKALTIAEGLMADIDQSMPLRAHPDKWKSRIKWVLRDKSTVETLESKLKSVESSLQSILSFEQIRISRSVFTLLLQQRASLEKIERGQSYTNDELSRLMAQRQQSCNLLKRVSVEVTESPTDLNYPKRPVAKLFKRRPRVVRLNGWGLSADLAMQEKQEGASSELTLRLGLFSKVYTAQIRVNWPDLSFDRMLHTQNMIPSDSPMVRACKAGDFRSVQRLLSSGAAHGNDVTDTGWPMLDYAVEGGSPRVVRLLLDHGASTETAYGESLMTPLQSAFLHGKLDVARVLLNSDADIEHVDRDGYSVLSYLWIVEEPMEKEASTNFLRLCTNNDFRSINSSDERGWTPFHRAAAIGTAEDIEICLKLGASLQMRTEWYGWTPLYFAASHDNLETFNAILDYSGSDILEVLDGDGWNLLHCATYFGAPKIIRALVDLGIDINQKTLPSAMPEDPELAYLELTARDIAVYMGPVRYSMLTAAISETSQAGVLDEWDDVYWDASPSHNWRSNTFHEDFDIAQKDPAVVFGAEDVDDKWNLLHWASYCGSQKVQRLLMMKGANPDRIKGITTYVPPVSDSAGVSEYTDGDESRPFVPASLIIGEDEVAEPDEIAPEFEKLHLAESEGAKAVLA